MATAVDFVPLVGIPGVSNPEDLGFNDYINAIYALSISIAALLAVVKLVIAGAKYMLSDIVTSKQDAKKDIEGALLGLLIVLAAVLILTTINSNITTFTLGSRAIIFEPQAGTPTPDTPPTNTYPVSCSTSTCRCDEGDTEVSRTGSLRETGQVTVICQAAGGAAQGEGAPVDSDDDAAPDAADGDTNTDTSSGEEGGDTAGASSGDGNGGAASGDTNDDSSGDDAAAPVDSDDDAAPNDPPPVADTSNLPAWCNPTLTWDTTGSAWEQEVLTIVNQRRAAGANCGSEGTFPPAGPLTMQANLRCAARMHSRDMENNDFFDHDNPNGDGPGDRIRSAGYSANTWGENIAWGYSSPAAVMQTWMDSDGHCSNIMNGSFTEIGIGWYSGNQWTQVFGRPRN